ncbi:hypothetical protein [Pedobacter namyangjuensis]|uniref:hypothetical protein n=1 Tax=Pedobacter namyangjuensis TaxID=600626 RepID=UPI0013B42B5C|nr:hypothetical protein [Pedobacter namyangjuensis]
MGFVQSNEQRKTSAFILNQTSGARATSNIRGEFSILAKQGDTLVTNLKGHKADTLIYGNQKFIVVNLKPSVINLKEVKITAKKISPEETYENLKEEYKEIYRKGDTKDMIYVSGFPPGIGISIDKIYNALSREGKNARKLQRILTNDYKNNVVDQKFNETLVTNITKLSGIKLKDFMLTNRPSYDFAANATELDLANYILAKVNENPYWK